LIGRYGQRHCRRSPALRAPGTMQRCRMVVVGICQERLWWGLRTEVSARRIGHARQRNADLDPDRAACQLLAQCRRAATRRSDRASRAVAGKNSSQRGFSAFACLAISRQRPERGTMCSPPAFIRRFGIVHSFFASSISVHVAPRVSPERAAVRISHSNARFVTGVAGDSCNRTMKSDTSE